MNWSAKFFSPVTGVSFLFCEIDRAREARATCTPFARTCPRFFVGKIVNSDKRWRVGTDGAPGKNSPGEEQNTR